MEDIVRVAEEIIPALPVLLGDVLRIQNCADYVKLTTTNEGPQCPLIYLSRFHEVCSMETARLS